MSDLPDIVGPQMVSEVAKHAMDAVNGLSGSMAEEIRLWLGEEVRALRFRRTLKLFESAKRKLADAGLKLNPVKAKILLPLIEAGSLEEDEGPESGEMFDRWASLLANASIDSDSVPPAFPEILKQLTSKDAQLFDQIERLKDQNVFNTSDFYSICYKLGICIPGQEVGSLRFKSSDPPLAHLDNLLRLRLIEEVPNLMGQWAKMREVLQREKDTYGGLDTPDFTNIKPDYRISELGKHFHTACQPPVKPEGPNNKS